MLRTLGRLIKKNGHGGLFSAISVLPPKTNFEAQDPEEKIILLLRPHPITNIWWILTVTVMFIIPFIWASMPIISLLPNNYIFVLNLFWFCVILTFIFNRFLMWFFSVNIVTDERIVDVDFYGLLFKQVDVAQIDKIQDVNYVQKGILGAFFNFGDVIIQTASEIPTFNFNKVPNPENVVKILSELISQEEQEKLEARVR